ncbi:MAG TPA: 16S rRNA (cytosine(1402)-N(4))-methyltransferase RsmH [Gammaproteobacteria bacterium]|nr:16S rRNA (cytosine(1402)-N(4))-methyltransferase RsmH [Gammaproteobacteria bacterium]
MQDEPQHKPVLFSEAVDALQITENGTYIDGTFGRGGHAAAILDRLGPDGRLIAIDKDPDAVAYAQDKFGHDGCFQIERGSFAMLGDLARQIGVAGKVDGVLLDLGVSSPQLDDAGRGFSFLRDGPLDMRMDPDAGVSAADWLARADARELAQVFWRYGEERHSRRVARAICAQRDECPITTTSQLAELVSATVPGKERKKHPATRVFQAIRIYVNRELEDLEEGLLHIVDVMRPGGRLVVISFHSLEDRIVKRFMRAEAKGTELPLDLPVTGGPTDCRLRLVGKPVFPGETEIQNNPRSRSAVMRIAERI